MAGQRSAQQQKTSITLTPLGCVRMAGRRPAHPGNADGTLAAGQLVVDIFRIGDEN